MPACPDCEFSEPEGFWPMVAEYNAQRIRERAAADFGARIDAIWASFPWWFRWTRAIERFMR